MAERTRRGDEEREREDDAVRGESITTRPAQGRLPAGGSNATRDQAVEPAEDEADQDESGETGGPKSK